MENIQYQKIKEHIGHKIECVYYGNYMQNVSIECIDCMEVIISEDKE
jgi:hypothetical protein